MYNWNAEPVDIAIDRDDLNQDKNFPDNKIVTSKYTVITFLPLNLFEQFQRLSNVYFLIIMGISMVPAASPITPVAAIMPLCVVLLVGAVKAGFEGLPSARVR